MIEVYKMLPGIYVTSLREMFYMVQYSKTRGNCLKIDKQQGMTNLQQNTFTLRVVNAWNSIPYYVVTAPSMKSFKNKLHITWHDHPSKVCSR